MDDLFDRIVDGARTDPQMATLLAGAAEAAGGDLKAAARLIRLRLGQGQCGDRPAKETLRRAAMMLALGEGLATALRNADAAARHADAVLARAEAARHRSWVAREHAEEARAALRRCRPRLAEERRASWVG